MEIVKIKSKNVTLNINKSISNSGDEENLDDRETVHRDIIMKGTSKLQVKVKVE
jgi:hypothetical protein